MKKGYMNFTQFLKESYEDLNTTKCNVVIINTCDQVTDDLHECLNCEEFCQDDLEDEECLETIEKADAIVFICNDVIDEISNLNLKNKVFACIVEDEDLKNELIIKAVELGMIVSGDCVCVGTCEDDLTCLTDCLSDLCNNTIGIRTTAIANTFNDYDDNDYDTYEEFVDSEQTEDPYESSFDDVYEEEERIIDNLDGSITQFHKGKKTVNPRRTVRDYNKK